MIVKGKIVEIHETQKISERFQKRAFVLEHGDNPAYLENCIFEMHQMKVDMLNSFNPGDLVTVHFNLRGRKYENTKKGTQYFNTLNAWKLEKDTNPHDLTPEHEKGFHADSIGDDDVPF